EFTSQGDNTLLIKDISVVRRAGFVGPLAPPPPAIPTIGSIQLSGSAVANLPFAITVSGANIVPGKIQAWVFDTGVCSGGCRHPDGGVINVTTGGLALQNVQLDAGSHYLKLRNTDSGAWSNSSTSFVVVPPPPSFTFTPTSQSKSVVAGQSVSFDAVLQGKNNPAGSANMTMYCMQACPAGFSYSYPYGQVPLPANSSITLRAIYYTSA